MGIKPRNIIIILILLILSIDLVSATAYNANGYIKYRDSKGNAGIIPYAHISVTNGTVTYSQTTSSGTDGSYSFGVPNQGMYYITISKNGYITNSFAMSFNSNLVDYDIYLDVDEAPNYITPNYVKFIISDIYGNKYSKVESKLYFNGSLEETKNTGTDGGVGFELSETNEYTLTFINSTQGISRTWEGYPTESYYNIIVFPDDVIPDPRQQDDILFGLNGDRINVSSAYINVTFNDTSLTTNYANLKIYQGLLNDTVYYSSATTDTNQTWSVLVPANNTNYTVMFTLNNDQMNEDMVITRILTFNDENRYDLGFDNGWNYILVSTVIIIGLFALFSRVNAEVGAMVGVLAGWFFWMLGWLNNGLDDNAKLTMGLMLLFGTIIAAGAYIRKGEDN